MASIEFETSVALPQRPAPRPSLAARLAEIFARWRKRRAQRLALADLMACSPYLLHDLGVTHADVAAALERRASAARRRS